jgi:uncharacterized membrane protein YcaP (DUF421 family)
MEIFSFLGPAAPLPRALVLTALAIAWTLLLARIVGLRAFSKATAFDYAATIATGSLIAQAGTRSSWSEYLQAMAAIGAIFLVQYLLARGRVRSKAFADAIDNTPILLMRNGEFLQDAMDKTRVTKATLLEKIRMSHVQRLEDVHAIVLETTGDIAVLTGDDLDPALLDGVRHIQ